MDKYKNIYLVAKKINKLISIGSLLNNQEKYDLDGQIHILITLSESDEKSKYWTTKCEKCYIDKDWINLQKEFNLTMQRFHE